MADQPTRYDFDQSLSVTGSHSWSQMLESESGQYVTHRDYAALEREREKVALALDKANIRIESLERENAELREAWGAMRSAVEQRCPIARGSVEQSAILGIIDSHKPPREGE